MESRKREVREKKEREGRLLLSVPPVTGLFFILEFEFFQDSLYLCLYTLFYSLSRRKFVSVNEEKSVVVNGIHKTRPLGQFFRVFSNIMRLMC